MASFACVGLALTAASTIPVLQTSDALLRPPLPASLLLAAVLIALGTIDAATRRLPDALTLPLIGAGLIVSAPDALAHAAAALAWFGLLASIAWGFEKLRGCAGLGLGDAKLMAAAAAWLGPAEPATVLLLACCLSLGAVAIPAWRGDVDRLSRIPFGPALAFGFWLVWLYGPLS